MAAEIVEIIIRRSELIVATTPGPVVVARNKGALSLVVA